MLPDFDPSLTQYTAGNAYVLMRVSEAAYDPDNASYFGRLAELGFASADQQWFTGDNDAGFLAWTNAVVVLCFRGTDNPGGWVSNLLGTLPEGRPEYAGLVHGGFADAVDVLWDSFHPWLVNNRNGRPLFLTGHSRGGALATLAAQRLSDNGIQPRAVYTFGAPRVGTPDFANSYGLANHYRVENDRDIVPHVPPWPVFQHVGQRHWINSQGIVETLGPNETPLPTVLAAAFAIAGAGTLEHVGPAALGGVAARRLLAPEFFTDHSYTEYAYWLWEQLRGADRTDAARSEYP